MQELVPQQDINGYKCSTMVMDEIPEFTREDYDLMNPKQSKKYFMDIEKSVRISREYNRLIMYLRNYMDMNKCVFFKNVTNIDTTKIKIHLHHHPLTLYDITTIVFDKRNRNNESLEVEMVAKEVMYIHYFLYVGLVPLAETVHELVHKQLLFIPLNIVLGNYQEFLNLYEPYISEDIRQKMAMYEEMTKAYNSTKNLQILQTTPIYLEFQHGDNLSEYSLPKLKDLLYLVNDKLSELKDHKPKGIIVSPFKYDNNIESEMIEPYTIITDDLKSPK